MESCQGALPAYDNVLRKRPLGIVNESNSTVFVTCSMTAVDASDYTIDNVDVHFGRTQAGNTTITCLLVPGTGIDGTMDAYVRSTQDIAQPLHWNATLIDRPWWRDVNLSCALPPGVELRYIETDYNLNEPGN